MYSQFRIQSRYLIIAMGYVCFKIKSPAFASINTPYWLDFKVRLEDLQCTNRLGTGAVGTLHKGCSITIAEWKERGGCISFYF